MSKRRDGLLAAGAAVVLGAVLAFGFYVLGPPQSQRAISADERRVQDLRAIAQQIYGRHSLPATLAELRFGRQIEDPVTHTPYEYRAKAATAYELCANFATASADSDSEYPRPTTFWNHSKGRQCFQLDAAQAPAW
jgi:hypothetical protein